MTSLWEREVLPCFLSLISFVSLDVSLSQGQPVQVEVASWYISRNLEGFFSKHFRKSYFSLSQKQRN